MALAVARVTAPLWLAVPRPRSAPAPPTPLPLRVKPPVASATPSISSVAPPDTWTAPVPSALPLPAATSVPACTRVVPV